MSVIINYILCFVISYQVSMRLLFPNFHFIIQVQVIPHIGFVLATYVTADVMQYSIVATDWRFIMPRIFLHGKILKRNSHLQALEIYPFYQQWGIYWLKKSEMNHLLMIDLILTLMEKHQLFISRFNSHLVNLFLNKSQFLTYTVRKILALKNLADPITVKIVTTFDE